jgi:hypothetical protein
MAFLNFFVGLIMVVIAIFIFLGLGYIGEKTILKQKHVNYVITFLNGWIMLSLLILITMLIVLMYGIGQIVVGLIL